MNDFQDTFKQHVSIGNRHLLVEVYVILNLLKRLKRLFKALDKC